MSGLAPSYAIFFALRLLYGIGLGGQWGVGTSLVLEWMPVKWRGLSSGLLREGYSLGYILAAIAYYRVFPRWGWRPMFFVGGLSDRWGRRRAMVSALLLATPIVPLWIIAPTASLMILGAFLMQFMVQRAFGVVPSHLNELFPDQLRGFFPGLAFQLGVLCASSITYVEALLGEQFGYAKSMGALATIMLLTAVIVICLGPEAKGVAFGKPATSQQRSEGFQNPLK